MEITLELLGSTRDHSAVSIITKSIFETRSGLKFLLGLVLLLASLASVGVAQTTTTNDNPSPKLVLRNTHAEGMNGQSLSPDGSLLATQHQEGVIKLWDVQSTGLVRVLKAPLSLANPKMQLYGDHAFSPDGKHLVSTWGESGETPKVSLQVWDVTSGTLRPVPLGGKFLRFMFTADSQTLIAWDFTGRVVAWNLLSGEIKFDQQAHKQEIDAIVLSTDQQTLATSSEEASDIKVWDLATRQLKTTIKFGVKGRKEMLFSPDDNFLAISVTDCRYPAMTKIYDTRTWKLFKLVDEYSQTIGFSSDSQVFATTCVCEDRLMLVNMKTGFELLTQQSRGFERTIKLLESIPELKLFRSGELVRATFTNKTVEWNSATGKVIGVTDAKDFSRETEVISARMFPTRPSNLYLSDFTDSALQFRLSRNSGLPLTLELNWQSLQIQPIPETSSETSDQTRIIMSFGLSRDGKLSAIRFNGKTVGVFHEDDVEEKDGQNIHHSRIFLEEDAEDTVFGEEMMISESANLIVTTSHTGKAAELLAELDKIREAKRKADYARYEAAQARKAAGKTEEEDKDVERNDPWPKAAEVLFKQLETLSGTDEFQTISIWDIKTGKRIQTMRGYRGWFQGGQFLNDTQVLVASHFEKAQTDEEFKLVVRFWDVQTGKLLHEFERSREESYKLKLVLPPIKNTFVTVQKRDKQTEIELRHLTTGKIVQKFVVPAYTSVSENSFSKDGKRLLVSDRTQSLLFDVPSGKLISSWEGDLPYRETYPFSPNGKMLVSYDARNQWDRDFTGAQLRDAETGTLLGQLMIFMDDPFIPFSPDGKPQAPDKPPVIEWLLFTPDGYYVGSEGAEKHFTWQIGERALPGAAFAKEFNRPDLVKKALQMK